MAGDSIDKGDSASIQPNVYAAFPPCVIPANELQPIALAQLKHDAHNIGKRAVVLVVASTRRSDGVVGVIMDKEGDLVGLQLESSCLPLESVVPAKKILRKGSWYLIKNPWARIDSDGKMHLGVAHPGDILLLPDDHEFIPEKFGWSRKVDTLLGKSGEIRLKGNDAVGKKDWAEAEDLYSTAVRVAETTEEASLAYLNRSFANLRLGRPATALADAMKSNGTDMNAPSEKGLFREASALYDLAKFDQCLNRLETLKNAFPSNTSTNPMIDRVKERLKEQQTGQYDFRRMYKQAKATPPLIDCATYIMPALEIRDSPGKGRGVFTKRKVVAGEMLICEKAFGYVYGAKDQPGRENMTVIDVHEELQSQIMHKLFHNIEDARAFAKLYHGDYNAVPVNEVDGKPVIDYFLVGRIINQTNYRSPRTSLSLLRETMAGNPFSVELTSNTTGVWPFISHINHCCISNVLHGSIGDMQIIRATRDLEAGAELLASYGGSLPFESYDGAQERLRCWGFTCDCALCLEKKATPQEVFPKRISLLMEFNQHKSARNTTKAEQVLHRLEQTYPDAAKPSESVRIEVAILCHSLGMEVATKGDKHIEVTIELALKSLEAHGFVISAKPRRGVTGAPKPELRVIKWGLAQWFPIEAFRALYLAYKKIAPQNAQAAKGYMEIAYSLFVGEKETMVETYPDVA